MTKIVLPTSGQDNWKRLLAETDKYWKTGNLAKALAHCWEEKGDIPEDVQAVLTKAPELSQIDALICIPEYQVSLPGGRVTAIAARRLGTRESAAGFALYRRCGKGIRIF
jgi:hypothetical protein